MLKTDTLTKSCSPTTVITANGEVQMHEEATIYVKELDIFLTMKVLETRQQYCRLECFAMETDIPMDQWSKTTSHFVREFTIVLLLKPLSRHRMHDHG